MAITDIFRYEFITSVYTVKYIETYYALHSCVVCAKMTIIINWFDTRLQWRTETGVGNWTFGEAVIYTMKDIWVPRFRLANCQSRQCGIYSNESGLVALFNNGWLQIETEITLSSTCDLNFICT